MQSTVEQTEKQEAQKYFRDTKKRYDNSILVVYWWNHGVKTKDFDSKVKFFLKQINAKITLSKQLSENPFHREYIVKLATSNMSLTFKTFRYEDAIRLAIQYYLTSMGDKSIFYIDGREYSINYHR